MKHAGRLAAIWFVILLLTGRVQPLEGAGLIVKTIWGSGSAGSALGQLDNPFGLQFSPDGALYVCEAGNHRIVRLPMFGATYEVIAGTGQKGYAGDGGPAKAALLNEPYEMAFGRDGALYFVERMNHVVRRIDLASRTISTVAGTGMAGGEGDGGLAIRAQLHQPHSLAFTREGRLLICDLLNFRIRAMDISSGKIEGWAGTGRRENSTKDSRFATAPLNGPRAIALNRTGNVYLALREGNAVFYLNTRTGTMTRIAGTGEKGYSGDGGPAKNARLSGPKGIACAADGSVYIADTENHAIRKVDVSGRISTLAGTGKRGDGPDGSAADAHFARPHGITVGPDGRIYVSDSENHKVRVIINQ